MTEDEASLKAGARRKRRIPRSFRDLTPTRAFNPRTFFYEMGLKALVTRRRGEYR